MSRFLEAALPSLGALIFFAIGLRALVHADRRERAAAARYEREQAAFEAGSGGPHADGSAEKGDDRITVSDESATETDGGSLPTDRR